MESIRLLLVRYLRTAWRHRWVGAGIAWLACGAGWAFVHTIPNQYESSARLFVDADAVLTPLLHGIAVDSSPGTQLEMLQRTLLSRPNLEKLISKTGLDLTLNGPSDQQRLLNRLGSQIKVTPQTRNLFTITFRDKSPKMAHDVVQALLTIFVEGATGNSRTDMENARRFLQHEIQTYEEQLRAAEKRRAEFRAKYIEILPSDDAPNVPALESARNTVVQLEGKLQDALIARDALKKEVETTSPLVVVEGGGVAAIGGPVGRTKLQEAEEQLRMLLLKDTDQHPDVIALRKLIESLRRAPSGGSPDTAKPTDAKPHDLAGPKRSVPNPVYDQLKVKLIEAETNVTSLQRQRDEAVRYRDRLESVQREQPGLIAEYQNLDRDYGVLRKNYEELLNRLQAANIAQAADTQADKVKLQIIDPPDVPRLPVAPNRMLLISAVLLAGAASGLGATLLLGQFDQSFSTTEELRVLGLPVLGGISAVALPSLRQQSLAVLRFGAAIGLLVAAYGGLVVHTMRLVVPV